MAPLESPDVGTTSTPWEIGPTAPVTTWEPNDADELWDGGAPDDTSDDYEFIADGDLGDLS